MKIKLIRALDAEVNNPSWLDGNGIKLTAPHKAIAVLYRGCYFKKTGDFEMRSPPIYEFMLVDEVLTDAAPLPEA